MRLFCVRTLIAITALMILTACGGSSEPPTPTATPAPPASAQEVIAQTLDIVMHDIYYGASPDNIQNPPTWTVKSGETVQLVMANQGALQHNWAVAQPGVEIPIPFDPTKGADLLLFEAGIVEPGQQDTVSFTAPAPGTYTVICTVAGHYPAMQGRLIVE